MTAHRSDKGRLEHANRPRTIDDITFVYGLDRARLKKVAGGVTPLYLDDDVECSASVRFRGVVSTDRRNTLS